jgi:hypothetical protein
MALALLERTSLGPVARGMPCAACCYTTCTYRAVLYVLWAVAPQL